MKIRAITYFVESGLPLDEARVAAAGRFLAGARRAFEDAGYTVQTTRLALPPLAVTFAQGGPDDLLKYAQDLEAQCFVHSIDAASLGVARPADPPEFYDRLPDVLAATETIFAAGIIASPLDGLSLPAIRRCAAVAKRLSTLSPDGLIGQRFAALANVEPGSPFFPAAYHEGGSPVFAVATEAADLALEAFTGAGSLAEAQIRLVAALEEQGARIQAAARQSASRKGVRFAGIDFSLAPGPAPELSLGAALEALGLPGLGLAGSAAAAAFVTDAISRARFPRTGFCGLLLSVLEDPRLAQRAAEGLLSVNDLLLYSSVCGSGLDMLPLPGDTGEAELAAVLLDVAALSLRHNKPLTARLLPIPGKAAGDPVAYESVYLTAGRVLALPARPLSGVLAGSDSFDLTALNQSRKTDRRPR